MFTKVVSFTRNKSLGVIQLATSDKNSFDYISGSEAIKKNFIEVKEISEAGSVNNLQVFNLSKSFVFFMDGDILYGAKQNRVLNTSVLLAPNTRTNLPVSCVEQGRWSYRSQTFQNSDFISPTMLRAKKAKNVKENLKGGFNYASDQSEVWDDVQSYHLSFNIKSPTSSLNDVYENKRNSIEEFLKSFELNPEANGLSIFVNNKLLSIDIFNRSEIFAEYFSKILRGSALEAYRIPSKEIKLEEAEAVYKTVSFLDKFGELNFEKHKGAGAGSEKRYETDEFTGFELDYEDHLIHLAALNLSKENEL